MTGDVDRLVTALAGAAGDVVVLSGAGVSVSSDIPAFRGDGGLWDRYDPMEYAHLAAFLREPAKVWQMLRELDEVLERAEPNAAHLALASMEEMGVVRAVVTQNVDGLHQEAGSRDVVELHGSRLTLSCVECGVTVSRDEVADSVDAERVPTCERCGGLLKPDVVFFGEELPREALRRAEDLARRCRLLLLVGTSAEVYPAAGLPDLARGGGAELWEVNPEPTLARARAVARAAEEVLPEVVERLGGLAELGI